MTCSDVTIDSYRGNVLLQYSTNNGITWKTIREHAAVSYNQPIKISVNLPHAVSGSLLCKIMLLLSLFFKAKTDHTTLRWWQPQHGGVATDQWSIDNIEIIWQVFWS